MGKSGRAAGALIGLPCACGNLRRATRTVTQLYAQELRPGGLGPSQFPLLWTLARVGETAQRQLGERLALDSTTLTRTLAPLIKRGWVEARRGRDRRERRLRLSAAGRRQLACARPGWERAQRRLRAALGSNAWKRLLTTLRQVSQAAQQA